MYFFRLNIKRKIILIRKWMKGYISKQGQFNSFQDISVSYHKNYIFLLKVYSMIIRFLYQVQYKHFIIIISFLIVELGLINFLI